MKYSLKFFIAIIVLATVFNGSLWYFFSSKKSAFEVYDISKVAKITNFLEQISPGFAKDLQLMVKKNNAPSWGCGPTSYALAKIINKKFFNDELLIDTFYDQDPYEIVQRFGFIKYKNANEEIVGDHAWLEIYVHDKMIVVDPTVAQYGKYQGLVYEVFDLGDPDIHAKLFNKYGILDARLSVLLRKVSNKIPINDIPYPGLYIDPNDMEYYQGVLTLRNTVSLGREPVSWKPWVDYFMARY